MLTIGQWVLALTAVIFLAEIIAGRHRGIYSRSDWFVNGICIFIGALVRPLGAAVVALLIGFLLPNGKGVLADLPFWPAVLATVLVGEFLNYWTHRLSHEWKDKKGLDWMWRMHRTHHSAKYVNVLLNFRISLFWSLVSGLTWAFALAFYLGLMKPAGVAIALFSFWGIFTHSDFRWDIAVRKSPRFGRVFRGIEHVFVSPGMHHSHHGYGKDGGNYRNFGVFLSIYDWMFGTLFLPEGRPFRYGIPGKMPHWADDALSPLNIGTWVLERRKNSSKVQGDADCSASAGASLK